MAITKQKKCLIIIKPDAYERGLVGEIISRIERTGLRISKIMSCHPTGEQLELHYNHLTPDIVNEIKRYMIHPVYPLIVMTVCGYNAIAVCRKIVGATEPVNADAGTIRGDFGCESFDSIAPSAIHNLAHASDSEENAAREEGIWFCQS